MHKLSGDEIELLNLLEQTTGARAVDVLVLPDTIVFLVKKGDLGRAIGRQGANITRLSNRLKKRVEVVEYSEELNEFLKNLFKPIELEEVKKEGETVYLKVPAKDKGRVIGRGGEKVNRARALLERHFQVALKIV